MKKTIFLTLAIFLILLVFPNITNKIGYKIRSVIQLQVGSTRDFKFPYRYGGSGRQDLPLIATKLVDLSKELDKRDIKLYTVFLETTRDNNNDVLSPLQSKIFYSFLEQDISQFKNIYTNKSVFSHEIIQQYPDEFTKRCEYRWMKQDAHTAPKATFYTYRALIEQMGMKHNWNKVEFKKITDKHSTELLPFISNINIMNSIVNKTEELPELQKYFSTKTNEESYQYIKSPNAINTNTILVLGDSFSLISVNYFTLFETVYFIRINRMGDNDFDLKQFLLDHPEIDNIIIQLSSGTSAVYHKEMQKLVDNLQE